MKVADGTNNVIYTYADDLISQDRAGALSTYLYDGLGSTRALSNTSGVLTDGYNYEAFGSLLNSTGTTANNYLYAGEQRDSDLGLDYLRARYLNVGVGRFLSFDTYQGVQNDPATLHKYLYVHSDPVNNIDPSGNVTLASVTKAVNIISTLATTASVVNTLFTISDEGENFSSKEAGLLILASLTPKHLKIIKIKGANKNKDKKGACATRNSFSGNTLVQSLIGKSYIRDIKIGDMVLSYNEETGVTEYKQVTHLIAGSKDEYALITFENGEVVKSTLDHPFYVDGKWVEASQLQVGDKAYAEYGYLIVDKVDIEAETFDTYNLTIDENHTYFVGDGNVLVHNCSPEYGGGALPGSLYPGVEIAIQGFVDLTGVGITVVGSQAYTGGFSPASDWDYIVNGEVNNKLLKKMKRFLPKGPAGTGSNGKGQDVFSNKQNPLNKGRPYIKFTPR